MEQGPHVVPLPPQSVRRSVLHDGKFSPHQISQVGNAHVATAPAPRAERLPGHVARVAAPLRPPLEALLRDGTLLAVPATQGRRGFHSSQKVSKVLRPFEDQTREEILRPAETRRGHD